MHIADGRKERAQKNNSRSCDSPLLFFIEPHFFMECRAVYFFLITYAGASELSDVQALTGCPRTPAASRTLRPGFSPLSAFRPLSSLLRCRRTRSSSLAPLRLSAPAVRQAEARKTAKRACLTKKNLAAGGAGVFDGRLAKEG